MCLSATGSDQVTWSWLAIVWKSCPILAFPRKDKSPGQRLLLTLTPQCLAVRGRQASPRCHPPHSPRTFRPVRNMPDVQIPQVMREFVTRGARTIQEWEPDRGLELERRSRRASEGSGCREQKAEERGGGALWEHVEGVPSSLFFGKTPWWFRPG